MESCFAIQQCARFWRHDSWKPWGAIISSSFSSAQARADSFKHNTYIFISNHDSSLTTKSRACCRSCETNLAQWLSPTLTLPWCLRLDRMIAMMVNNPIIKHQLDDLFVPSLVKEINGHMVGLVGYLTPHTKFISNSGKVARSYTKDIFCVLQI